MSMLAYIWRSEVSLQHVLGMAAILVILAIIVYVRNFRRQPFASIALLLMRLSIIAALTVLLMGPSTLPPAAPSGVKPPLHVYLDTSGSMLTEDVRGQKRIAFAIEHWLSPAQLAKLSEQYAVKMYSFDAAAFPLSPLNLKMPPDKLAAGKTSLIAQNLRQAIFDLPANSAEQNGGALLVLSDGRDSLAEPLAQVASLAKSRFTAIHAVAFGGVTMQQDLALSASLSQRFLIAKEPGSILVKVRQTGLDQTATTLHIRQGSEHTTRPIAFNGQREIDLTIPIEHDKPGTYDYTLTIDAAKGETETGNNTRTLFCEVTGERIKVLVLEGEPYWDTKFLTQSLRKDASIELTHITQMSLAKQSKIVTRGDGAAPVAVPTTREDWAKYNVVILGRALENLLTADQAKQLAAHVDQQGGHVIYARGQPYSPGTAKGAEIGRAWATLDPVVWGNGIMRDLSLALTPQGAAEPCFTFSALNIDTSRALASLKALHVLPMIERTKVGTQVLARAVPHGGATGAASDSAPPAIVRMPVGSGQVVAILGEGLWQWSQLPPKLKEFDGMYDTFWSNLVRSLAMGSRFAPHEQVSLELGTTDVRQGDPLSITIITRTEPKAGEFAPILRVTDPAGLVHEPALVKLTGGTRSQATFKPQVVGVHTVTLDASPLTPARHQKKFSVFHEDIERLESSADPDAMRALATETGGLFFTADQSGELPAQLARLLAAQMTPNQPEYAWNRGYVLALLLLWMGVEWLARRAAGLI